MTAIQSLLAGLFDYAGLYPPAGLSLSSATNNYLGYARGEHAKALGRFIINVDRLDDLRSIASESLSEFKLSVIISKTADLDRIADEIRNGIPIEALEIKSSEPEAIERIATRVPRELESFFEVGPDATGSDVLRAIADRGLRAKIRMGGVVAEAFPPPSEVIRVIEAFAKLRLPFKATAGLHHPIRSKQPLTYEQRSARGTMHGFVNLCCAAAVLFFDGEASDAKKILLEEDSSAWTVDPAFLQWRHLRWTKDQLSKLRHEFLISIGTCSFEEPFRDLEALGWL